MPFGAQIIPSLALITSFGAVWYARKASLRADENSVIPLAFFRTTYSYGFQNFGDAAISNIEWNYHGEKGFLPVLKAGEIHMLCEGSAAIFAHIFSDEAAILVCDYPPGRTWRVSHELNDRASEPMPTNRVRIKRR